MSSLEEIKKRVMSGIHINRVPKKTKELFIDFANSEFEGDYGMALKMLMDVFIGFYPSGHEEIEARLEQLEKAIGSQIKPEKKKPRVIRTVGGKEIIRKEE